MNNKFWRYGVIFGVVLLCWNTKLIYPLKIFTVFLHELSHATASLLVGGKFHEIHIDVMEGGYTLVSSTGGMAQFIIVSSGYVGSALLGAVILVCSQVRVLNRNILILLGSLLVIVTLFYSKLFSFTTAFSIGFLLFALLLKKLDNKYIEEWIVEMIGITSLLYALIDIWDDTIRRRGEPSDAYRLYELTHIPTVIWGVIWIFLTLLIMYNTFRLVRILQICQRRI